MISITAQEVVKLEALVRERVQLKLADPGVRAQLAAHGVDRDYAEERLTRETVEALMMDGGLTGPL